MFALRQAPTCYTRKGSKMSFYGIAFRNVCIGFSSRFARDLMVQEVGHARLRERDIF
jgi:hypothetical protein